MRKFIKYVPSFAAGVFGVGVQVSGIEIPWIGYGLMGLAFGLLIIPGWPHIKRARIQSPISFTEDNGNTANSTGYLLVHFQRTTEFEAFAPPGMAPASQGFLDPPIPFLQARWLNFDLINCSNRGVVIESLFGKVTRIGNVEFVKDFPVSTNVVILDQFEGNRVSHLLEFSSAELQSLKDVPNSRLANIQVELTFRFRNKPFSDKEPYINQGDLRKIAVS